MTTPTPLAAEYECWCGHTHGTRNLVLHCGSNLDTVLLWTVPADTDLPPLVGAGSLPVGAASIGKTEIPALTGAALLDGAITIRCYDYNAAAADLYQHGGRRHLIAHWYDCDQEIRCRMADVDVHPVASGAPPPPKLPWTLMATVDSSRIESTSQQAWMPTLP